METRPLRVWWLGRTTDQQWYGCRNIRSDDDRFARRQCRDEHRRVAIEIATSLFHGVTIMIVCKPMNDQCAKLAKHVGRNIARPLRCKNAAQAILPSLLRNETKSVEIDAAIFVSDCAPQKLMGLVQKDDHRPVTKYIPPCAIEQKPANDIQQNLACMMLKPHILE